MVARNKAVVAKIATTIAATTASTLTLLFAGKHIHSFNEMQTTWVNQNINHSAAARDNEVGGVGDNWRHVQTICSLYPASVKSPQPAYQHKPDTLPAAEPTVSKH